MSKSVEITKDLSNAQAEAEDKKMIINLFKRKLGTDKEEILETAPFQEFRQLNSHQSGKQLASQKRIGDTKGNSRIVEFDENEEKSGDPEHQKSPTLPHP